MPDPTAAPERPKTVPRYAPTLGFEEIAEIATWAIEVRDAVMEALADHQERRP